MIQMHSSRHRQIHRYLPRMRRNSTKTSRLRQVSPCSATLVTIRDGRSDLCKGYPLTSDSARPAKPVTQVWVFDPHTYEKLWPKCTIWTTQVHSKVRHQDYLKKKFLVPGSVAAPVGSTQPPPPVSASRDGAPCDGPKCCWSWQLLLPNHECRISRNGQYYKLTRASWRALLRPSLLLIE